MMKLRRVFGAGKDDQSNRTISISNLTHITAFHRDWPTRPTE